MPSEMSVDPDDYYDQMDFEIVENVNKVLKKLIFFSFIDFVICHF